jgi:hypothetical protein
LNFPKSSQKSKKNSWKNYAKANKAANQEIGGDFSFRNFIFAQTNHLLSTFRSTLDNLSPVDQGIVL